MAGSDYSTLMFLPLKDSLPMSLLWEASGGIFMLAQSLNVRKICVVKMNIETEYGFFQDLSTSVCRSGKNGRLAGTGKSWPAKNRSSNLPLAVFSFSCFQGRFNLSVRRAITSKSSLYAGQAG